MEILAVEGFKIYGLKTRTKNADEINGDGKSRPCGLNLQKNFMTAKAKFTAFIVVTKTA